jgi:hypothetical protein
MIDLTEQQRQELAAAVRAEVYERLWNVLSDDTVFTTAEMLDRLMSDDDARAPYLADLQKKYGGVH